MAKLLFLIGTGSFIGGILRFIVSRSIQNSVLSAFPYGTFVVNMIGCLLIGIIYGFSERTNLVSAEWRLFLTVGFCGGFTTFSTFANENLSLIKDDNMIYVALYAGSSVFFGILATYLGSLMTKMF